MLYPLSYGRMACGKLLVYLDLLLVSRVVVAISRWLLPGSVCNRIATRGIDPSHRVLKTHPASLIKNADKLVFADSYRLVKDHSPVARKALSTIKS